MLFPGATETNAKGMWTAAVLAGTALVLGVVAAVLALCWRSDPVPVSTGDKSSLRDWSGAAVLPRWSSGAAGSHHVFPVFWNEADQGFVVTLQGHDAGPPTQAVLDTGSHGLVLATTDCDNCLPRHRTYRMGPSAQRTGEQIGRAHV
jgi:hypothetical protein